MKKKADVAHRQPGDAADFLVAQPAVKSEIDNFALVVRKRSDEVEHLRQHLTRVVLLVEVTRDRYFGVVERCGPRGRPPCIERQIPAHGEQPWRDVVTDSRRVLAAKTEERLLHDVAGCFQVPEKPPRIADQRLLVPLQCVDDPLGFRRPNHVLPDGITTARQFY